jgi:hypothetical protein
MKHVLAAGLAPFVLLVVLLGLIQLIRPMSPSAAAIDTAHTAVELARDVAGQNSSATLWTGGLRLLGLVLGISIPLVIAYLLWRDTCKSEPAAREVLADAAERGLLKLPEPAESRCPAHELPSSTDIPNLGHPRG